MSRETTSTQDLIAQHFCLTALNILCVAARHRPMMTMLQDILKLQSLSLIEQLFGYDFKLTQKERETVRCNEIGMTRRISFSINDMEYLTQTMSIELQKKCITPDINLMLRLFGILTQEHKDSVFSMISDAHTLRRKNIPRPRIAPATSLDSADVMSTDVRKDARTLLTELLAAPDCCHFMANLLATRLYQGHTKYQKPHAALLFLLQTQMEGKTPTEALAAVVEPGHGRESASILFPAHAMTHTLFCNPFLHSSYEEDAEQRFAVH